MPTAWPLDRFEQTFVLYTLLLAGLLDHPKLQDVIEPQIDALAAALRPVASASATPLCLDGGSTAAALAVLHAA